MTRTDSRVFRRLIPLALLWLVLPDPARGFARNSVLITDPDRAALVLWNPETNTGQDVVVGLPLVTPLGVAVEASGTILVADSGAGILRFSATGAFLGNLSPYGGYCDIAPIPETGGFAAVASYNGGIYTFDAQPVGGQPSSYVQTFVSNPTSLARAADGTIYATNALIDGAHWIGRETEPMGELLGGPDLGDADGLSIDRFGNLLVASGTNLVGILPSTGAQRGKIPVAQSGEFTKKALPLADRRLAVGITTGSCARTEFVDPVTGAISAGLAACAPLHSIGGMAYVPGPFVAPAALAEGDILVTDTGAFGGWGAVLRIKPTTGASSVLLLGGVAARLGDVAVTPEHEIWVLENDVPDETSSGPGSIFRLNPRTGRTKLISGLPPTYDKRGIASAYGSNGDVEFTESNTTSVLPDDSHLTTLSRANDTVSSRSQTTAGYGINWFPGALSTNRLAPYIGVDDGAIKGFALGQGLSFLWLSVVGATRTGGVAVDDLGPYLPPSLYSSTDQAIYKKDLNFDWVPATLVANVPTARMIDVDANGQLLVAVKDGLAGNGGGVIRIDTFGTVLYPPSNTQTIVFQGHSVDPYGIAVVPKPACSDGVDDDGDGLIDYPSDPGCRSALDLWETNDCSDGIDNDDDGAVDYLPPGWPNTLTPRDRGCANANAQTESPQCDDGVDNDYDGKVDLADPYCASVASNNRESAPSCGLLGIEPVVLLLFMTARRRRAAQRR